MNSSRLAFLRNRRKQDSSSSDNEGDSSSSSDSESSSSKLSSSASSANNSDAEVESSKLKSTSQSSMKNQPSVSTSKSSEASKASESSKTSSSSKSNFESSSKITATQEIKTKLAAQKDEEEVKLNDKKIKKYSKLTEDDAADVVEDKKSKNTALSSGIPTRKQSTDDVNETAKSEEAAIKIKMVTVKKSVVKSADDKDDEKLKPEETKEKLTKVAGVKESKSKNTTAEEISKNDSGKISKEISDASSKDTSEKNSKGLSERISKFSSGTSKKFDSSVEKESSKEAVSKIPLVKTSKTTGKSKRADGETDEKEAEKETPLDTNNSSSSNQKNISVVEKISAEQPTDSEKPSRISKLKKPSEKIKLDDGESATAEESEKPSKISKAKKAAEKAASDDIETAVTELEQTAKTTKVKKSKEENQTSDINSTKDSSEKASKQGEKEKKVKEITEDQSVKPAAEKVSKKSKSSSVTSTEGEVKEVEALTGEGGDGSALTPEVASVKETVKKRKKSPAKEVEETHEKDDNKKPLSATESKQVSEVDNNEKNLESNKLSVENEIFGKAKKEMKRSSKSPTPVSDAVVDDKQVIESADQSITTRTVTNGLLSKSSEDDLLKDVTKEASTKSETTITIVKESMEKSLESVSPKEDQLKFTEELTTKEPNAEESEKAIHVNLDNTKLDLKKETDKNDENTDIIIKVLNDDNKESATEDTTEPNAIHQKTTEYHKTTEKEPEIVEIVGVAKTLQSEEGQKEKHSIPIKAEDLSGTALVSTNISGTASVETSKAGEDNDFKSTREGESVDDFIQRILSEVRSSDERLKQRAREREEAELEEQNEAELFDTKTKISKEECVQDEQTPAAAAAKTPKSNDIEKLPEEAGPDETKPRSRYSNTEEEELAILAKYFGKKGRQMGLDLQDIDASDELDKRAKKSAEMRRRRLDPDYEYEEESDYSQYARTMAGPRVSKRNIQRYNFGEPDFDGKEEGYLSRFRRERGGRGGALPEEAFIPRRSEETPEIVRQQTRGVRTLIEKQTEVADAVKKASKGLDELEKEILGVKQLSLGHRAHVEALESALDAEARAYENEYQTAVEGQRQRRVPHGSHEKKEDILSLMFGTKPAVVDPAIDTFSTPAVASFLNIYGSGGGGATAAVNRISDMVNGVTDQRLSREVNLEAEILKAGGSKVDEYLIAAKGSGRRENGRDSDLSSSLSGWSPAANSISVDTSASDEFLNRVRSKYPILSSSSEQIGNSRFSDFSSSSSFLGTSSESPWTGRTSSRGTSSRSGGSGFASSGFLPNDNMASWRDRGTSTRRTTNFGDDLGGLGGGEPSWRRAGEGSDAYIGRSISTGIRSRRS